MSTLGDGYPLKIVPVDIEKQQTTLWESFPPFIRSTKSEVDKSNIYYVWENKNSWLLSNDTDQIKAIKLFGGHYLRPVDLLVCMLHDNVINIQKAVWIYKKMKAKDPAWVPKEITFAEYSRNNILIANMLQFLHESSYWHCRPSQRW